MKVNQLNCLELQRLTEEMLQKEHKGRNIVKKKCTLLTENEAE